MKRITIELDEKMIKKLKKRADKNFLSVREMVEDIVRRSMVSYTGGKARLIKVDDKLVAIFSRERRGRKPKKKLKKKKK